jgi:hypothetical protein
MWISYKAARDDERSIADSLLWGVVAKLIGMFILLMIVLAIDAVIWTKIDNGIAHFIFVTMAS